MNGTTPSVDNNMAIIPSVMMWRHRKLQITALNEKSEDTASLCLEFGEVHAGVCVTARGHVCMCVHAQETQKLQWWGASRQCCCHTCAVNNRLLAFLFNFNRQFPRAMAVSQQSVKNLTSSPLSGYNMADHPTRGHGQPARHPVRG